MERIDSSYYKLVSRYYLVIILHIYFKYTRCDQKITDI